MDSVSKIALLKRALALKHKLKVYDSMETPKTHEELAITTIARWKLEDELKAIEELLEEDRSKEVKNKKLTVKKKYLDLDKDKTKKRK